MNKLLKTLLIEKDADVKKANNDGWTPLYIAAENGHLEVIKLLIKKGADVNKADNCGWTSLYIATKRKDSKVL